MRQYWYDHGYDCAWEIRDLGCRSLSSEMNTDQTYLCLLSSRGRRGSSLAYLSLDGGLSRTECASPL